MNKYILITVLLILVFGAVYFVSRDKERAPIDRELTIVALGDSLTYGFEVGRDDAYPAQLEDKLRAGGYRAAVINEGISGDTSAGVLARLDAVIALGPDMVILAIGYNDGLRQTNTETIKNNISRIIEQLESNNISVLLCGMRMHPLYNLAYASRFKKIYEELADEYKPVFMPHFLDDIILNPKYNTEDGLHPNREGYTILTENLYPYVVETINELK